MHGLVGRTNGRRLGDFGSRRGHLMGQGDAVREPVRDTDETLRSWRFTVEDAFEEVEIGLRSRGCVISNREQPSDVICLASQIGRKTASLKTIVIAAIFIELPAVSTVPAKGIMAAAQCA
jgi:hypothetical protein